MINLGLSDYQLWRLTLREFGLLLDRYVENEEKADRRVGRVLAMIANVNKDPKKGKAYSEDDFIPKAKERKVQSVEEQKAILSRIGGK